VNAQPASAAAPLIRHPTATGFVVWRERVLLHWHQKLQLWLPCGGHLEANEDPVQCAQREVLEECGLAVEVFGAEPPLAIAQPRQLPPPVTILVERLTHDGLLHEHIDFIYFCRPRGRVPDALPDPTMRWLSAAELLVNGALPPGEGVPAARIPDDVRLLALMALERS
jgi:8-oxo-dGTP pyrophosphatase MutT (NUDIX family)